MAFAIPDDGVGLSTNQSVLFTEDFQILSGGISRRNCVLQGCLVTATTLLTLNVALGSVLSANALFPIAADTVVIGTADATNPRIDLVVITSAGAKAIRAGTAAATPNPPALTTDDVVLAIVYVPALATTMTSANIYDRRMLQEGGPMVIDAQFADLSITNTNAIQTLYTETIPASLLSMSQGTSGFSGARLQLWGDHLVNSSQHSVTLTVSFGGVTLFADVTSSFNTSANRRPWNIELMLNCESATSQNVGLRVNFTGATAIPSPSTGEGDISAVAEQGNTVFGATGTVNTDTADRVLLVQVTMSSGGTSNTILRHRATLEIL